MLGLKKHIFTFLRAVKIICKGSPVQNSYKDDIKPLNDKLNVEKRRIKPEFQEVFSKLYSIITFGNRTKLLGLTVHIPY